MPLFTQRMLGYANLMSETYCHLEELTVLRRSRKHTFICCVPGCSSGMCELLGRESSPEFRIGSLGDGLEEEASQSVSLSLS